MTITLNGTTGISSPGGFTGGGVSFADTTPANTLVTTSAGNIGIGTTSPGNNKLVVENAAATHNVLLLRQTNVSYNTDLIFHNSNNTNSVTLVSKRTDGNLWLYQSGANDIIAITNGSERLRINNAGNVGIGTSSPSAKLDVAGNIAASIAVETRGAFAYFQSHNTSAGTDLKTWRWYGNSGGNLVFERVNDAYTTADERLRITNGGSIGIGTATPAGKLHTRLDTSHSWGAAWGAGTAVFGGATSSSGALGISYNDTDGAVLGAIASGVAWKPIKFYSDSLIFATNGTNERMRVDSSGNVLIGTTTPTAKLTVSGSGSATAVSYGYLTSSGAVGFTSGSITYSIRADGRIACPEFNAISDSRKKKDVLSLDADYNYKLIKRLRPVQFTWKGGDDAPTYGFIAQEVAKAGGAYLVKAVSESGDPDLVEEIDSDGFVSPEGMKLNMNYDAYTAVLTSALHAAIAKIEALEARIAELESKL